MVRMIFVFGRVVYRQCRFGVRQVVWSVGVSLNFSVAGIIVFFLLYMCIYIQAISNAQGRIPPINQSVSSCHSSVTHSVPSRVQLSLVGAARLGKFYPLTGSPPPLPTGRRRRDGVETGWKRDTNLTPLRQIGSPFTLYTSHTLRATVHRCFGS